MTSDENENPVPLGRVETECPRCGGYMLFVTEEEEWGDEVRVRVEHLGVDGELYAATLPVTRSLLAWQARGGVTARESIGVLMENCVDRVWAKVRCDREPVEEREQEQEQERFAKGGWLPVGTMSEDGVSGR